MQIRNLNLTGHFEDQPERTSEHVPVVLPENDLERRLLAWTIMPRTAQVTTDETRRDYVFQYQLGEELDRGLYRLRLAARDASQREHEIEIAAGLVRTIADGGYADGMPFVPFWFISDRIHFKPGRGADRSHYPGPTYGRLRFEDDEGLPHRRLFGATVRH